MHYNKQKSGRRRLRFIGLLLAGLSALLPNACIDDINLEVPSEEQEKMVIQGTLTQGTPPVVQVRVTRSSDITVSAVPERVNGAKVWVEEQGKPDTLMLLFVKNGDYSRSILPGSALSIGVGRSYRINVVTPEGSRYQSDWEMLPGVPEADSLSFSLSTGTELNNQGSLVEKRYIHFYIHTPLLTPENRKAYLKWDFLGCYVFPETPPPPPANPRQCYVTQQVNLDEVAVFDGNESASGRLTPFELFREPLNHRFGVAYYLTVYQESINVGAYRYWDQVGQVIKRTGSFFETPPGPIRSNLHNPDDPDEQVLGYFYARSIDTIRKLIEVPLGERPATHCLPPVAEPGPYCQNCLLWPGASRTKPDYWIE